jgi:hypothetical protein
MDNGNSEPNGRPIVKSWINKTENIKNTDLQNYCNALHNTGSNHGVEGDFTVYCYDYDDVSSSPNLKSPYNIDLIVYDIGTDSE